MKNITKLGLTALAGSLVASAAYAGSMSVSGSAKVSHASGDEKETQGNSWSNSKGISSTTIFFVLFFLIKIFILLIGKVLLLETL